MKDILIYVIYFYNLMSLVVLFSFLFGKLNLSITKINHNTGKEEEVSENLKYFLIILLSYGWFIIPFVNEISKLGRRHRKNNEKKD